MDRPTDRPLEPGQHVIVAANRLDDVLQSAPMDVEQCSSGPESIVQLRIAGAWRPEAERRHQLRVPLRIRATRARRWAAGARGVGVGLDDEVHLGDRLSLAVSLGDGQPDLRVTVELRHVRRDGAGSAHAWRAGGLFRSLAPPDHERIIRFIFAELRSPSRGSE
jgi:hypothetical protein